MYNTSFSTKDGQFENYFKDISKRLKEREKPTFNDEKNRLDIVIVVNMMLTGFDAKKLNTLYVDKNLTPRSNTSIFKNQPNPWRKEITR